MEAYTLWFAFLLQSLLLVIVNCELKTCKKIDDCSCTKSDGKTINLHPIDAKPGPKFAGIKIIKGGTAENSLASWNPCTPFKNGNGCQNVLLCQADKSGKPDLTYPIGKTVDSFTENDADGSIIMTFKEEPYDNYKRHGVLTLKCDKGKEPGELSEFTETSPTGSKDSSQYTATFSSKCICDGGCPEGPGGNGSTGSGPSTGSILLIVFLPLVFIYFVGGILYNKYKKGANTFGEMVPNHSFWSELPFLVKDGCVFTFHGVAGCCSSLCMKIKGDSYAEI